MLSYLAPALRYEPVAVCFCSAWGDSSYTNMAFMGCVVLLRVPHCSTSDVTPHCVRCLSSEESNSTYRNVAGDTAETHTLTYGGDVAVVITMSANRVHAQPLAFSDTCHLSLTSCCFLTNQATDDKRFHCLASRDIFWLGLSDHSVSYDE